jgi:hypothetical protein
MLRGWRTDLSQHPPALGAGRHGPGEQGEAEEGSSPAQESHDPPRVGLTHTGVCRSARMGLIGRDGVTKITIHQQGLFPVQRSSDRDFLSALRALDTPRHDRMIAPLSSRSLHTDSLVCAPRPQLAGLGRANPLDANECVLAALDRPGLSLLRRAWQRRASCMGLGASSAACRFGGPVAPSGLSC